MIAAGLARRLDVDAGQWRALVTTGLRADLRTGRTMLGFGSRVGRGFSMVAGVMFVKLVVGATLALVIATAADRFLASTLYFTLLIFTVASALVLDFQTVVISPEDHALLAYQPISSRTFMAARLTTLLIYLFVLVLPMAALPCVALLLTGGISLLRGAAAVAATGLTALTTALVIVALYTGAQQWFRPERMRTVLTALQLTLGLVLYSSATLLPAVVGRGLLSGVRTGKPLWLLAIPGAWFTSIVEMADGRLGWREVGPAALALVAFAAGARLVAGRLSLDYADRLGAIASTAGPAPTGRAALGPLLRAVRPLIPRRFTRDEGHAVALLVRAQFRFDMKFRLAVLGIVPLTAIYLIASLVDPAGRSGDAPERPRLVYFAVLMFPVMLQQALARSDAYLASWIYHATPARPARLMFALKDFVFACFVLPYVALVGALMALFTDAGSSLPLALVTVTLTSHAFLLLALRFEPHLPFSVPAKRTAQWQTIVVIVGATSVTGQALAPVLRAMTASVAVAAGVLGALALGNVALQQTLRARVERLEREVEFSG